MSFLSVLMTPLPLHSGHTQHERSSSGCRQCSCACTGDISADASCDGGGGVRARSVAAASRQQPHARQSAQRRWCAVRRTASALRTPRCRRHARKPRRSGTCPSTAPVEGPLST